MDAAAAVHEAVAAVAHKAMAGGGWSDGGCGHGGQEATGQDAGRAMGRTAGQPIDVALWFFFRFFFLNDL